MLILLPPSEGKTAPRRGKPLDLGRARLPGLDAAPRARCSTPSSPCARGRARPTRPRVLGLGPTQADAVAANARLRDGPDGARPTGSTPACSTTPSTCRRCRGRRAAPGDLAAGGRPRRSSGWSGPADRIPAYRLSGDATLPGLGTVAGVLARRPRPGRDRGARRRAARRPALRRRTPRSGGPPPTWRRGWRPSGCCTRSTARRQVVSHFNKATKGRLVRALLEDGAHPRTPAALADLLGDLGWKVEVGRADRRRAPGSTWSSASL